MSAILQFSKAELAAGALCLSSLAFGAGVFTKFSTSEDGSTQANSNITSLNLPMDPNPTQPEIIGEVAAPPIRQEVEASSDAGTDMADMKTLLDARDLTITDLRNQIAQLEAEKRCLQDMLPDPFAHDERYLSLSSEPELQSWLKDFLTVSGLKLENLPAEGDYWERFVPEFRAYREKAIATVEENRQKYSDFCASVGNDEKQIEALYVAKILDPWQAEAQRLTDYYGAILAPYLVGADPSFRQHLFGRGPEPFDVDQETGQWRPRNLINSNN